MSRLRRGIRRVAARARRAANPLIPPEELGEAVGGGDYVAVGDQCFALFRRAGLRPTDDVLDVGCGSGRMARPMVGWLEGTYEGFDVAPASIAWCTSRLTPRHPNFRFTLLDVANDYYNPGGGASAAAFSFPYSDDSFDFAIATSVFTHLVPAELLRYLGELARVVRSGGAVFATYYLLDTRREELASAGLTWPAVPDRADDAELGEYRLGDRDVPSTVVAYDRGAVEAAHAERGLAIESVWPGRWGGSDSSTGMLQDVTLSRVSSS